MSMLVADSNGAAIQIVWQDVNNSQVVAVGAASVPSGTFPAGTNLVRLCATVACWYATGSAPTATAGNGSNFLPANAIEYLPINRNPATSDKIAVLQASAVGSISMTPCHD